MTRRKNVRQLSGGGGKFVAVNIEEEKTDFKTEEPRLKRQKTASLYKPLEQSDARLGEPSSTKNQSQVQLKILYFIQQSNRFIHAAHKQLHTETYFQFVKAAIRSLRIILKKYERDMTSKQRVAVYYQLGKVYLEETENRDKAELYVTIASRICHEEFFVKEGFFCDLVLAKIMEKSSIQYLLSDLSTKISQYQEKGYNVFADCLALTRINYLLASDYSLALVSLQSLLKSSTLHPTIRTIATVYLCGLLIHRGDPSKGLSILKNIDRYSIPSQPFQAYYLLLKLSANLTLNRIAETKHVVAELYTLKGDCVRTYWSQWSTTGNIEIFMKCETKNNNAEEFNLILPWLSQTDFFIITFLLNGITYLGDKREMSKNFFEKALRQVEKSKEEVKKNHSGNFSLSNVKERLIKLKYYKYMIQFYLQYHAFIIDNFKVPYIDEFMAANNECFSKTKHTCFRTHYPYINYMFALYYHRKGDLQAAKFYYLKVRNITSDFEEGKEEIEQKEENDVCSLLQQMSWGVGCDSYKPRGKFSELYVYSSLHLVALLDYEVKELMHCGTDISKELFTKTSQLRNTIGEELKSLVTSNKGSSDLFQTNFLNENTLLKLTMNTILNTSQGIDVKIDQNILREHLYFVEEKTVFYLICFLFSLELSIQAGVSGEQEEILQKALNNLPFSKSEILVNGGSSVQQVSTTEPADSCRVFLLRDLHKIFVEKAEYGKADMYQLSSARLSKLLSYRYQFLANNVVNDF
ncbi:hypothetical protein KGF56_003577 [Candida oxycetoniae]|uniref:Uncharacterized protein n=1 Tax=Candida oxycetoniae TaxID=497107 RepID=A0AAI9SVU6_9ASCO|nr:uncharacterized protein KGF56_003577 [Candida oxycetoniae]KAI3403650.2 hypothetical protein KGF56_003577 [Candida oxycetoniae]